VAYDPRNPAGSTSDYVGAFEGTAITTAQVPTGKWAYWYDTTNGRQMQVRNRAGVLQYVELDPE